MKALFVQILSVMIPVICSSQPSTVLVIACKSEVICLECTPRLLAPNDTISADAELKLSPDAWVTLLPLPLPNDYIPETRKAPRDNYANYIISNIYFHKDSWSNKYWQLFLKIFQLNRRNIAPKGITVIGGKGGYNNIYPMILPVNGEVFPLNYSPTFLWNKDIRASYHIVIFNESNHTLPVVNNDYVTDTVLKPDLPVHNLNDNRFYWTIAPIDTFSPKYFEFTFANAEQSDSVNKELEEIEKNPLASDEMKIFYKAMCYEKHNMVSLAYQILELGNKVYPNSPVIDAAKNNLVQYIGILNNIDK